MMLFCIGATIYTNSHIPNMEGNLVTAASELTRFRKIHAEWLKIGIPLLTVWISWLIVDLVRGAEMSTQELIAMISGIGVGLFIGLGIGLKVRREIMDGAEELIGQINELQGK